MNSPRIFRNQIWPGKNSTVQRKRSHVAPESLTAPLFPTLLKQAKTRGCKGLIEVRHGTSASLFHRAAPRSSNHTGPRIFYVCSVFEGQGNFMRVMILKMRNVPVTPNPSIFPKVLPCKWEAYCSTNGKGFPLRSLEARKVRRYKWGAYCRTNWRCTAVLFRQVVGVGVSETLLRKGWWA